MAARSFDPSLVQREGFHVVGVSVRTTNSAETDPESSQVGRLWQRFFDENVSRRTPGAVPGLIAGVYSNYERAGEAEYDMVLGPVVTRADTVPDGLHLVSVPGGRYLAFPVEGMPPTATLEAWSRIDAWFASGHPFRRAFTYDIELYRPGVTEILVSIEPTTADNLRGQLMSNEGMTTIIARFGYRHEGELAKGYLDDAGIDSMLFVDDASGIEVGMAFVNKGRLVVRNEDAERAREVLRTAGIEPE